MPLSTRRLSIRSPSLTSQRSTRSTSLTPPLPRPLKLTLQFLITSLIAYYELLIFLFSTFTCSFNETPSKKSLRFNSITSQWESDSRWNKAREEGFKVLIVSDPQLLDMNSYSGRNWLLKKLSIWVSKSFEKKSWWAITRGRGVEGVVWNGDLGDNLIELAQTQEQEEDNEGGGYEEFVKLWRRLFPLPRRRRKGGGDSPSSQLDPPVPVVFVPGNHDLGLHGESQLRKLNESELERGKERFEGRFGRLWGEVEWGGWNLVWIDSMNLIEGREGEMKDWLEELGKGEVVQPRILFSHVPLWRPSGTGCGKERESKRNKGGIEQGRGKGYQNLIGEEETKWLLERVRPEAVFSGDDHDSCHIQHPFRSPLTSEPISETTVKSFSMVMGVSNPGYTLLNLYPSLPPTTTTSQTSSSIPTLTTRSCTLPSQLSIYLHIYLPLSLSLFLFFLLPKLLVILRSFLYRRQRSRTSSVRGHNGLSTTTGGHKRSLSRSLSMRDHQSRGGGRDQEELDQDQDSLFPTFPSTPVSQNGSEYSYSAGLGEDYDGDGVGGGRDLWGNEREEEEEELLSSKKVRRVSRVWLWDKNGDTGSSSNSLPTYSNSNSRYDDQPSTRTDRLRSIVHSLLNRLSQNSLLLPLLRLLRPLLRLLRTVVFGIFKIPLELGSRLVGGEKGLGRAFGEAAREFGEVVIGGIGVWVLVLIWIGT
ncbi:hypothetical protein JCM5353_007663 [Sporobolomyces roseus]